MNSEAEKLSKRISKKYLFVIIITVIAMVAIITTFSILSIPGGGGG